METGMTKPLTIMIASPLEAEHIANLRAAIADLGAPIEVLHDADLYPPMRYDADHYGPDDWARTPEQEARWAAQAASADITFDFPYSGRHPHTYAPNLRWVQTTSAGVGQAAKRLGITGDDVLITTASGVHARPLAEFALLCLLMAVKEHDRLQRVKQQQAWERFCSGELSNQVLAIIGPGRIGREVARMGRAFDMIPVALGRDNRPERAAELGVERLYTRDELHEMLARADAVVLCAPHTPQTENIMDRAAFEALRPGVVFVNIGRGQLVDEDALAEKLQDGTIRFAGLDVFRTEPLPLASPLWTLPNVLINPHSAGTSTPENGRIMDIFIHNLRCYVQGQHDEMRNVLDVERMY